MTSPRNTFRKGTEALNRGLHRGADALAKGIHRGADAMDRGLNRGVDAVGEGVQAGIQRGARACGEAGIRLRDRFKRGPAAGGGAEATSEGGGPDVAFAGAAIPGAAIPGAAIPGAGRNPDGAFPTNPPEASGMAPAAPSGGAGGLPPIAPETYSEHFDDPKRRKTMCIFKSVLRVGVIGGLLTAAAVGGTVLIAGPERSTALFDKAKDHVINHIDSAIDDPSALRAQLKELEAQYPERISMLRGDLAELNEQVRQLERDEAVSGRVVELAERDIDALQPLLAQAHQTSVSNGTRLVSATINHDNRIYTVSQASARLQQIQQTKIAYANRAADASHDLVYLRNQAERLGQMLVQLETERAQFQTQIAQLERQVDAVARNERLIGMLEKRQRTLEECSRYEAASLDHMVARLSEVRSRQEATLEYLTGDQRRQDYESIARMQIEADGMPSDAGYTSIEVPVSTTEGLTVVR